MGNESLNNVFEFIIGGGLASSEAAWQATERGIKVILYEMRPFCNTKIHNTGYPAEIVCTNSFGSKLPDRASGLLKNELQKLNLLLLSCAYDSAIPAGSALAVDRKAFSELVTHRITSHPNTSVKREELKTIPETSVIISLGPLTSYELIKSLINITGQNGLYFFDAISSTVYFDSLI